MKFFAILTFYATSAFVLISVHELGHYLAGRIGGIPWAAMRIRLFRFPQHVELRDGCAGEWVSPVNDLQKYVELIWQYLQSTPRVYGYVSGGLLGETAFTVCACAALIATGRPKFALVVACMSVMLFIPWLLIDSVSVFRGRVNGDLSGMWSLARWPTAIFVATFLLLRAAIIWRASN